MKKFLLTLSLLSSVGLSAQNTDSTISLEEAVNLTMTNNPTLKALEYEEKAAKRE